MNWELWDLGYNDGAGINIPMLMEDQDYIKGYSAGVNWLIRDTVEPKHTFYQHTSKTN